MPRNMITRMVKGTLATVKLVDKDTDTLITEKILLERTPYKEGNADKAIVKAIRKQLPDSKMLVSVEETEQVKRCFGITAEDFMSMAVELDPATRKPITKKEA